MAATQCQVTVTAFNSKGYISTTLSFRIVVERAPASLSYDEHAASQLIVGVETQLAPRTGFVAGEPAATFKASNAGTVAALALEDALRQATAGSLNNAI